MKNTHTKQRSTKNMIFSLVMVLLFPLSICSAHAEEDVLPPPSFEEAIEYGHEGLSGFSCISEQAKQEMIAKGHAPTYGELTPKGIRAAADYMMERLKAFYGKKMPKNLVFMDVGSGAGKVPLGVCVESGFNKCIGVEYDNSRHEVAVNAHKKIVSKWVSLVPKGNEVVFINDDALKVDMRDVNAIYISSCCFTEPFMKKLLKKFEKELPDGAVIITTKDLPTLAKSPIKLIRKFTLSQTWQEESETYAYQKGVKDPVVVEKK